MPRSSCDPCCNPIAFAKPAESFHAALLQIECAILAAVEGSGPGTSCCHNEDTPAVSGDSGTPPLFVRSDSPATLTDTNGDYSFGVVNQFGVTHTTMEFAFQDGANDGILKRHDDAFPSSAVAGVLGLGIRNDSLLNTFTSADLDYSSYAVTSRGAVHEVTTDSLFSTEGTLGVPVPQLLSVSKVSNTAQQFTGIPAILTGHILITSGAAMTVVTNASQFSISGNPQANPGDVVHVTGATNSSNQNVWAQIEFVTDGPPTTEIQLRKALPVVPTVGDTINIYRPLPVTMVQESNQSPIIVTSVSTQQGLGQQFVNLVKFEDDPTSSGDPGIGILLKRADSAATQTSAAGDYTLPVANNNGAVYVDVNRGFQISDPNGILKAEDAAAGTGEAGVAVFFKRTDTAASQTSATNDYTLPVANSFGCLHSNIDRTFQRADADGILKAEDAASASGDAGVAVHTVRQDTLSNLTSADGDYAAFKSNTEGAAYIANTFEARTTNPTATADAVTAIGISDKLGRQAVVISHVRDLVTDSHTQIATSSAETTILAAGAAGVFHDLTCIVLDNATAATATTVTLRDATGGAARMIVTLGGQGTDSSRVIVPVVPIKQTTAANNWTAQLSSAAVTVNIFVQAVKNL